jgi:hypothetical protein
MMTFEQFFLKKKIDLTALQASKPDLFSEFKEHYAQMGEKSFDHTKKYWFNQLRLSHKLSEDDEVKLKAALYPAKEAIPNQELKTEVAVDAPVTKAPGFKPRFKAPTTTNTPTPAEIVSEVEIKEIPKPVSGFKPRFKAASTIVKQEEPEAVKAEEEIKEESKIPITGFKPRFKAASTPVKQEEPETVKPLEEIKEELKKPDGFKPRFKPGSTPTKQEDKED